MLSYVDNTQATGQCPRQFQRNCESVDRSALSNTPPLVTRFCYGCCCSRYEQVEEDEGNTMAKAPTNFHSALRLSTVDATPGVPSTMTTGESSSSVLFYVTPFPPLLPLSFAVDDDYEVYDSDCDEGDAHSERYGVTSALVLRLMYGKAGKRSVHTIASSLQFVLPPPLLLVMLLLLLCAPLCFALPLPALFRVYSVYAMSLSSLLQSLLQLSCDTSYATSALCCSSSSAEQSNSTHSLYLSTRRRRICSAWGKSGSNTNNTLCYKPLYSPALARCNAERASVSVILSTLCRHARLT
uniref:Uncharacterized protein n=1 Tax=Lygus hesperus TaxID=30085 RepID=A0A146MFE0_LYGHE